MKLAIVGHAADKFTAATEAVARRAIGWALSLEPDTSLVSGRCHLGGVDVWAEEIADGLGLEKYIFPAVDHQWYGRGGYKARNLKIAETCDSLLVIVVERYPLMYDGMRFDGCYHCGGRPRHVKSGACWTANQALKLGKKVTWEIILNGS
jgi:hypothetical protein